MRDDRDERIDRLERAVVLLTEVVRDGLTAIYDRDYGGLPTESLTESRLNAALGRLDAILGPLGLGRDKTTGGGR